MNINYYEELNISPDYSLEQIKAELVQQERVWHQREISHPEKAHKTLALLEEAKRVFADSETKATYDRKLKDGNKVETIAGEISQCDEWLQKAIDYINNGQNDLALTAIKKAISYQVGGVGNGDLNYWSAVILRVNNRYDEALENINTAIVLEPSKSLYYVEKANCYSALGNLQEAINTYSSAIDIANGNNNSEEIGNACGYYAWFLLHVLGQFDIAKGEANEAVKYGDKSGLGRQILQEMSQPCPVSIMSPKRYLAEQCLYNEQIRDIIKTITSVFDTSEPDCGWILAERKTSIIVPANYQINFWGQNYYHNYLFVLDINGNFVIYDCDDQSLTDNSIYREKVVMENDDDKQFFMREFDYDCQMKCFYDHGQLSCTTESNRVYDTLDEVGYKETNRSRLQNNSYMLKSIDFSYKLIRKGEKGKALLEALQNIVDNNVQPRLINTLERQRLIQQQRELEKKKKEEEKIRNWKAQGKCQFCGGEFKGLITKKCSNCGRVKNY